jgi:hypothetical protein
MEEPLAELAAYFRTGTTLPDEELARLTVAARAAGSRWDGIAAACGIKTYQDLAGVIYRITGDTGAELLYSAIQYAVGQLTGSRVPYPPLTWACRIAGSRSPAAPQRPAGARRARPRPGLCPPRPGPGRR